MEKSPWHYCHVCRRETTQKRISIAPALLAALTIFTGGIVWVFIAIYEARRPLRCGVCGTTYSLIDLP